MAKSQQVVSYQRVSSLGQNLSRQEYQFTKKDFDRHYQDKVSGSLPFSHRPAGKRLIEDCENGLIKEVHIVSVDRIGRNAADVTATMQYFANKGVNVVIVKEGIRLLNDNGTVNPTASIVLSVMTALAEIERNAIKERQMEGIAIAKAKGIYVGRRAGSKETVEKFLQKPKTKKITQLLKDGMSVTHVSRIVGVSPVTVTKVKRAIEVCV